MSDANDKFKHSKRLQKEENAIHRQQKIAKTYGAPQHQTEAHRFSKHHAMNCGDPSCTFCSNPRKTFKELTAQEKKLFQDLDRETDRKSNGIKPKEEE